MQNLVTNLEVLKVAKPIVEFNYQAMKAELERVVGEWQGFVIGEDDLGFAKGLMADLNKKKKAIDDFRKATKKELSEPIAEFEEQCKELVGIIENVRSGIEEQYESFEERRKQEKMLAVQEMIRTARDESGLPELYQLRIELKAQYLNKTMKEAEILKDIAAEVEKLQKEWQLEKALIEQIEMQCELVSAKLGLNIPLDPKNFTHIEAFITAKAEIEAAGERAKKAQDDAIKAIEDKARRDADAEAQRQIEEKAQEMAADLAKDQVEAANQRAQEAQDRAAQAEAEKAEAMELVGEMAEEISEIIPVETDGAGKESYLLRVYANEIEFEALMAYMARVGINCEIIA